MHVAATQVPARSTTALNTHNGDQSAAHSHRGRFSPRAHFAVIRSSPICLSSQARFTMTARQNAFRSHLDAQLGIAWRVADLNYRCT